MDSTDYSITEGETSLKEKHSEEEFLKYYSGIRKKNIKEIVKDSRRISPQMEGRNKKYCLRHMNEVLKRETVSILSVVSPDLHLYCSLQQSRSSKESVMGSHPNFGHILNH